MAYTKTTWSENDIITAEKLNNIEEGVSQSNSVYEIELTEEEFSSFASGNYTSDSPLTKVLNEDEIEKILKCNLIKLYCNTSNLSASFILYLYESEIFENIKGNWYSFLTGLGNSYRNLCLSVTTDENTIKIFCDSIKFNS